MAFRRSPVKLDKEALWSYALRILAQRPHSLGELRQKLVRRAAQSGDISATLDKLREYGMADDQKFSEAFASARLQNQGFGKQRVMRDLRTKQVSGKTAEEAISKVFESTDEVALIKQFIDRKYRGKDLPLFLKEDKNLMSAYRRLRLAGFASAASLTVLREYKADLPDVDEDDGGEISEGED